MLTSKKNVVVFRFLILSFLFYLFVRPTLVETSVKNAIQICGNILLPSLFPFMILSTLLLQSDSSKCFSFLPTERFFHLPRASSGAILLGILCGFPVGAKVTCELYRQGKITKHEAERLIPLANHPGPAFVTEVIGSYCWGSRSFGVFLLITEMLSSFLIGFILARVSHRETVTHPEKEPPTPHRFQCSDFTSAVSNSAISVISVCAFVIFFSVLSATADDVLSIFHANRWFPFFSALLEFTNGAQNASALGNGYGAFLTGFTLGWSGLCVLSQSTVFMNEQNLSAKTMLTAKLFQGVLNGCAAFVYFRIAFSSGKGPSAVPCFNIIHNLHEEICLCIVIAGCLLHAIHVRTRRNP